MLWWRRFRALRVTTCCNGAGSLSVHFNAFNRLGTLLKLSQKFSLSESRELVRTHPDRTWVDVPADVKEDVRTRINTLLADENIPQVGEDVIRWRMGLCVRDVIRHSQCLKTLHSRRFR